MTKLITEMNKRQNKGQRQMQDVNIVVRGRRKDSVRIYSFLENVGNNRFMVYIYIYIYYCNTV